MESLASETAKLYCSFLQVFWQTLGDVAVGYVNGSGTVGFQVCAFLWVVPSCL